MRLFLPALDDLAGSLRGARRTKAAPGPAPRVLGIWEGQGRPQGRALVSFATAAYLHHRTAGGRLFNPGGAANAIVRAVNALGFSVDLVDYQDEEFRPREQYDLWIAHGAVNFRRTRDALPGARVVKYATGAYWRSFHEQSVARYERFARAYGAPLRPHRRPIADEDAPSLESDLVICLGEMTAESFRAGGARRVVPIDNAAYAPDNAMLDRDWATARRRFVFAGGTGNVQKGLDLVIEAFAGLPSLRLDVFAPVEPDLREHMQPVLRAPNIHYTHHLRFLPRVAERMRQRTGFTLYAGFNSGQSTALVGSLGEGLVPVVNRESDLTDPHDTISIAASSVEGVRAAAREASERSTEWLEAASRHCRARFREHHAPEVFERSFRDAVASVL